MGRRDPLRRLLLIRGTGLTFTTSTVGVSLLGAGSQYARGNENNADDASLAASEAFQSPAAPFGIWVGIAWRLDRRGEKR